MHITVIGVGGIGTYFGLRMQEAGCDVTFLVREKRAQQIREKGLKIFSPRGDLTCERPKAVTNPEDIESVDVAVLAVKGYHLPGMESTIKTLVEKGAYILPFLNGVEHLSWLEEIAGKDHLLGGVAYIVAALNDDGHVIHTGNQHTFLYGALTEQGEDACQKLKEVRKVNMGLAYSEHIERDMWQKYVFISAFSGLTTSTRLAIGGIRKSEPTLQLGEKILEEMGALAKACGVTLPDVSKAGFEMLKAFPDEATSSMHQDLIHGRPLEVEHLFGGALRLAERHGLKLPHIETIYAILKPHEAGKMEA